MLGPQGVSHQNGVAFLEQVRPVKASIVGAGSEVSDAQARTDVAQSPAACGSRCKTPRSFSSTMAA